MVHIPIQRGRRSGIKKVVLLAVDRLKSSALHHAGSIEIIPVTGQLLPPDRHSSLRPAVGGGGQIVPVALIPEPPGFHIAGAVKAVPVVIDKLPCVHHINAVYLVLPFSAYLLPAGRRIQRQVLFIAGRIFKDLPVCEALQIFLQRDLLIIRIRRGKRMRFRKIIDRNRNRSVFDVAN